MNWNFEGLDLLGAVGDVQTDCQICKIAINHNNGGVYWKKRYNRMVEVANNLRALIAYDNARYSAPFTTEKYAIDELEKEEQEVRIKQKIHDVTFHLDVEPNYNEPTEGKGENDAVTFTMGQYTDYTDKYNSLDASVSTTVEEARKFAEALLKICDDIEGITNENQGVEKVEKKTLESQLKAALTVEELLYEVNARLHYTGSVEVEEEYQAVLDEIHKVAKHAGSKSLISLLAFEYGKEVERAENMSREDEDEGKKTE